MSSVALLGPHNEPKLLAAGASPQTPLGAYIASPGPLAGFKRAYLKPPTSKGSDERERKGRGTKMIYAPGDRNPGAATVTVCTVLDDF